MRDYGLLNLTRSIEIISLTLDDNHCDSDFQDTKCELLLMADPYLKLGPFLLEHKNRAGNYIAQVGKMKRYIGNYVLKKISFLSVQYNFEIILRRRDIYFPQRFKVITNWPIPLGNTKTKKETTLHR